MKQTIITVLTFLLIACNKVNHDKKERATALMVLNYDPDLQQRIDGWWYKGKPFSGYMIEEQRDHHIVYKLPITNGKEHGLATGFYDTGEKLLECFFSHGKKDGIYKQWWPNGNYRYLFNYKNDLYDGTQTVFFRDGKKREMGNYLSGEKEGLQQVWNVNGQLISNYTIRNKKLYGIISVKSCMPGFGH